MTPATRTAPSVAALKAAHDDLHAEWFNHVTRERCERCADGRWRRVAGDLCDRANTAGLRWEQAERKAGTR